MGAISDCQTESKKLSVSDLSCMMFLQYSYTVKKANSDFFSEKAWTPNGNSKIIKLVLLPNYFFNYFDKNCFSITYAYHRILAGNRNITQLFNAHAMLLLSHNHKTLEKPANTYMQL